VCVDKFEASDRRGGVASIKEISTPDFDYGLCVRFGCSKYEFDHLAREEHLALNHPRRIMERAGTLPPAESADFSTDLRSLSDDQ